MLSADDVRDKLKKACEAAGSQRAWAQAHGVSAVYVNDILNGRREPAKSILEALGLERVVQYRAVGR